jgi:Uma2 family endonuclease
VEIESPSTRLYDRRIKTQVYAELKIPSYWRVTSDAVHLQELADKSEYAEVAVVRPGTPWRATQPYPVLLDPGTWAT